MPIILVLAAVGLFILYTNPTYQASKSLRTQEVSYDDALTKSQQLRAVRDGLLTKRSTFSADDVQKLQELLPDNVDNIRFIIDVNNIASRHNISLTNVELGTIGNGTSVSTPSSPSQTTTLGAVASNSGQVGSVDVGFTINASYNDMLSFLQDLEHSVRIIDVQKLTFTASGEGTDAYVFTVRTYWLH